LVRDQIAFPFRRVEIYFFARFAGVRKAISMKRLRNEERKWDGKRKGVEIEAIRKKDG